MQFCILHYYIVLVVHEHAQCNCVSSRHIALEKTGRFNVESTSRILIQRCVLVWNIIDDVKTAPWLVSNCIAQVPRFYFYCDPVMEFTFFLFLYLNTLRQMFVFHVRMDICEYRYKLYLTLSVPNFRQQLSSAFVFSLLTNYRLERSIYATLKDWISNSVDPDKMAHYELSHLDLCCLQKPIIIACGSERVKVQTFIACVYIYIYE